MSKVVIGLIVTVVLVVGGVGTYFLLNQDAEDGTNETTQTQETNTEGDAPDFTPVSTEGEDFVATFTIESEGQTSTATIEHDGAENWHYTTEQNGQTLEIITTSDGYYSLAQGVWYKYPINSSNQNGFDQSDYEYDASEITAWRASSHYEGRRDCPAGTCDVWSVSDTEQSSTTIYVDTQTQRISKVESTTSSSSSSIEYEYKEVTITPPENFQELPNFNDQ